jgi:ribosomal protein L6P/L9E
MNNNDKQFVYTKSNLLFFENFQPVNPGLFFIGNFYCASKSAAFLWLNGNIASAVKLPQVFNLFVNKQGVALSFTKSIFFSKPGATVQFSQVNFKKLIFGTLYGYYNIIQFVGFRYRQRWFKAAQVLKYRIGYSKKVWVKCPTDFVSAIRKISPKKRTHFFFSFNKFKLRQLIEQIHNARPATRYKGRGVNIKEQPMVLKEGKKALW